MENYRLSEGLPWALGRYHASGVVVDEDAPLATEVFHCVAFPR